MEILAQQEYHIKPSKCVFGTTEVEYLGHIITAGGVKVDPSKISACKIGLSQKMLQNYGDFWD